MKKIISPYFKSIDNGYKQLTYDEVIDDLQNEIENLTNDLEREKSQVKEYGTRLLKTIEYIEQQMLHKFQDTTGGLTYNERKLLDILKGDDKDGKN